MRKPSHYTRRELPPLNPALERELQELIRLRKQMVMDIERLSDDMIMEAGPFRSWLTAVKRDFSKRQAQLRKDADKLDTLNASHKDERLSAAAADLRKAAVDLLMPGKRGIKRQYPAVTWELMGRLTKSGLTNAAAARHTERLLGMSRSAHSIESQWSRRRRIVNK